MLLVLSYYKCFKTAALLPFCCALLTAGFATRAYGAVHYDDAQVYTASTLLVYLSPQVLPLQPFMSALANWLIYLPLQSHPRVGQLPNPWPRLPLRPLLRVDASRPHATHIRLPRRRDRTPYRNGSLVPRKPCFA